MSKKKFLKAMRAQKAIVPFTTSDGDEYEVEVRELPYVDMRKIITKHGGEDAEAVMIVACCYLDNEKLFESKADFDEQVDGLGSQLVTRLMAKINELHGFGQDKGEHKKKAEGNEEG